MKKTLIAVAVLGSFTAFAVAESNVTLYGIIDESVIVSKADKGGTVAQLNSGFTAGSRFGFRGVEDLGGGNAVGFILEQGIKADTGAIDGSGAFARESNLYVKGGWGQLSAGRLGTLGFAQSTAILQGAVFGTTYGPSGWAGTGRLHYARANNSLAYKSPSFGGFTFHAMYSNQVLDDDSATKWSLNTHYYGIGAQYVSGDIKASIIYEGVDNKGNDMANWAKYHLTLGGSWNLGMITPMAIYQYGWGTYRQHAAQIGATAPVAGGTAMIGFKYVNRNGDEYSKEISSGYTSANLWNVGVAYAYPLSKRTKTYAYAGYTDGSKGWGQDDFGKNDYLYNGWAVGIGMVHNF